MSSKQKNIVQVFNKLEDLKKVFNYGQKIIPIIQNLIDFMGETVPLLENINDSILESTSKIPKASHKINDVTHATELATTEILDMVDNITTEIDNLEKTYNKKIDDIKSALTEEELKKTKESIKRIKDYSNNITLSLQVQDITAQQLAAVNHLIESVQKNLAKLINDIEEADLNKIDMVKLDLNDNIAFDPDASYIKKNDHQKIVDSIIDQNNISSQEEIDKLFYK
ncbi:hypothetical protein ABRY23_12285 [Melioribacteraceae bacterium 4301-Me]|uniref:hypothetical protein n=1 Tax=Pyranulibacter aquaticus TaxID=3163344 RepID=UPI0035969083